MYKEYFGLKEDPFSIAPDPHFLYMSEKHREALAHLLYGMKADSGFVLLTGEVGTGKTTVCRCLLNQIPDNSEVAFILNPKLSVIELLATICDELGIEYPPGTASIKVFVDRLNLFLLEAHSRNQRTILIIDEAQNLGIDVLEQIRLLTNLETDKRKLLQVILLGQPELNHLLERPELRQLAQRVTARYHLEPLLPGNLNAYLSYRLATAGVERPLFSPAAVKKLYRLSGGVPRLINLICDRALLGAYAHGEHQVSSRLLIQAAREVFGSGGKQPMAVKWLILTTLLLFIAAAGGIFLSLSSAPLTTVVQQPVVQQPVVPAQTAAPAEGPAEQAPSAATDKTTTEQPAVLAVNRPPGITTAQSREQALQAALTLWGYSNPLDATTFSAITDLYGLELLEEVGELTQLRTFNHLAILSLADPFDLGVFYAILTSLDGAMATLVVGTDLLRIPVATLLEQWDGYYIIPWQPPPGYNGVLRYGDAGLSVFWLEQQLAELQGRQARDLASLQFDHQLLNDVRRFQRRFGLTPDGLVGPHTLIVINSLLATDQPRLATQRGQ